MADKKAAASLTVIEGGNKKTAEQIAHEQTAERCALDAWAKTIAVRVLSEMSNFAAETLARTQVDDQNDEETDEDFLNEQRDIENELVEKEIDAGLEAYPDVAALHTALDQSLRTYLEQETALEKNEIEKLLGEIRALLVSALEAAKKAGKRDFPTFRFEDRFTPGMFTRLVRKALKKLFEADPVFSKHVRDDVPGRNPKSWGQNCRTSSSGTYAKVDDFVNQGGLAALFSGGWKRIAKDRIEPWAWSYEVAPERKNPQANWRHRFYITERNGERSILEIPREYLVGNGGRAIKLLMKAGVHVINRRPETLALARHLHWKPKREIVRMPRATWHQIGRQWIFVTADETITPPDMPTPTQTYELETKAKADSGTHIPAGSTVEDWKTEVANPLRGNSNVTLVLGTFFAAPVLRFSGEPGGGFHLYGPSTIGKTMASAVGQSIWGYPHETDDVTFGRSWGGTEAGFDALAAARADLGLSLDEITLTDRRTASQAVYKLASGTKGPRATSSGGLRTTMHSPVLVLSTGERSLAEFLDTEIQEGCKRRMSDVPAEVGEGTAFEKIPREKIHIESKRLFDAMKRHHGAVGREWLRYLVNLGPAKFIPLFNEARRAWLALPEVEKTAAGVHPQVQAVVNRFALLAAVLRMVIAARLLPGTVEETDTDIIARMSQWAKQRGNLDTAGELLRAADRVRTTITTTLTDRYIHLRQAAKGRLIPAKAADNVKQKTPKEFDGYVKPDRILIWPEAWRRLCEGHDPIKVAEHLQRQKVLMPGARKGELARTETILGKSGRFYVLRREWLGGGA